MKNRFKNRIAYGICRLQKVYDSTDKEILQTILKDCDLPTKLIHMI